MSKGSALTRNQWALLKHWIILVIVAELLMLFLSKSLFIIYLVIGGLFLAGFILRVLHLYPDKDEPLILDSSAALIAVIFALLAKGLGLSGARFILIFTSSLIILPHLLYIVSKKDI